jgi:Bacterial lectin
MIRSRWLGAMGCLFVWSVMAQADPTIQTFDGGGTPYTLTGFGGDPADDTQAGPSGKCCRLTQATNSGLNTIAFDRTQVGPVSHVLADFDFRIGDSTDGRSHGADGIGFILLNTQAAKNGAGDVYDITGDGPQITEEAEAFQSLGIGFDTWHNNPPFDPNDNHVSVWYTDAPTRDISESAGNILFLQAQSLYGFGNYKLHRATLPDNAPFDHASITVDAVSGGANVTVTITPAGGSAFSPISNVFIPGFVPYEMRVAFGARTGGENENHDIDNVNVTFSP